MSINTATLAQLTSLTQAQSKRTIFGVKNGYNTTVMYFRRDNALAIRIFANCSDKSARDELYSFSQANEKYSFVRMWDGRVTAMLSLDDNDTEGSAAVMLGHLYDLLSGLGFEPCCSTCGEHKPAKLFAFAHDCVNLCPECEVLVNADVDKTNSLLNRHKPKVIAALPALLIAAFVVFISARYAAGSSRGYFIASADGLFGISIASIIMYTQRIKPCIITIVLNIILCFVGYAAGNTVWHAEFFADFNKEHAAEQQYIFEYCDSENNGGNPYNDALVEGDTELIGKYKYLHHCTPDEREQHYKAAKRIIDHQTTWSCIKDFKELMFSDYGDNMRSTFMGLNGRALCILLITGVLFWGYVMKIGFSKYSLVPLSSQYIRSMSDIDKLTDQN